MLTQKLAAYISQGGQIVVSKQINAYISSLPAFLIPNPQTVTCCLFLQTGYYSLSYGASPMATALATRALVTYDQAAGSTTPDLKLTAAVGDVAVLKVPWSKDMSVSIMGNVSCAWMKEPQSGTFDSWDYYRLLIKYWR